MIEPLHKPFATKIAKGFTLIELMTAMFIGLLVIAAGFNLFIYAKQSYVSTERYARMQEGSRYAMDIIADGVRYSGAWGETVAKDFGSSSAIITPSGGGNNCSGANINFSFKDFTRSFWVVVQADWTGCDTQIPASGIDSDSDVIITKYVGQQVLAGFDAARYYVVTDATRGYFVLGTPTLVRDDTARVYDPAIYYVTPAAGLTPPRLMRRGLYDATPQVVIDGVEKMHIILGYISAGSITYDSANNLSATDWENVVTARIDMLIRMEQPEGDTIATTYTVGPPGTTNTYTPGDNYRRIVLTTTVFPNIPKY